MKNTTALKRKLDEIRRKLKQKFVMLTDNGPFVFSGQTRRAVMQVSKVAG